MLYCNLSKLNKPVLKVIVSTFCKLSNYINRGNDVEKVVKFPLKILGFDLQTSQYLHCSFIMITNQCALLIDIIIYDVGDCQCLSCDSIV